MDTRIDEETVAELRDAVRDLLRDEDARAESLTARATALAGFVGVIVAVVATLWPVGSLALSSREGVVLAVAAGSAIASLIAGVVTVIVCVLLQSPGARLATGDVRQFPTLPLVSQPRVVIQGALLGAYVTALTRERERNAARAHWLKVAYVLVAAGLLLTMVAGAVATIEEATGGGGERR